MELKYLDSLIRSTVLISLYEQYFLMNTIHGGLKQLHVPQICDDAINLIKLKHILLSLPHFIKGSTVFFFKGINSVFYVLLPSLEPTCASYQLYCILLSHIVDPKHHNHVIYILVSYVLKEK